MSYKVKMQFTDKNTEECVLIVNGDDGDMYLLNTCQQTITLYEDIIGVFKEIDFRQGNLYVLEDEIEIFKTWIRKNTKEIDKKLENNLLNKMQILYN